MGKLIKLIVKLMATLRGSKPFPICDNCNNDFHVNYKTRQVVGALILRYTCVCGHDQLVDFSYPDGKKVR